MTKLQQLCTSMMLTFMTTFSQASDIEFEIYGVNSNEGKLYIQLFKGEDDYQKGNAISASIINAKKGSIKVAFYNIDQGEYALRFFHDENNNGKLETNLFGAPVEGYGFSNDAKPNFGPVAYSEAKFAVPAQSTTVINKTSVIY